LDIFIFLVLFIALSILTAAIYPKLWFWTLIGALTLLLGQSLGLLGVISAIIFWLFFLGVTVILNIPLFRQQLISNPLLVIFRKLKPKMSQTEEQALNAGDTWWERQIFQGNPNWREFNKIKLSRLSKEENAFLLNETATLCDKMSIWQTDYIDQKLSPEIINEIGQKGFLGFLIDKKYGGKKFSACANSKVAFKICSVSSFAGMLVVVSNSLGPGELILHYGDEKQKKKYLPALAKGKMIPCFGLTAPTAGSDAASLIDSAVVCYKTYKGTKTLGLKLNFFKRYITLAPIAQLIGVAVKVYDPKHLLSTEVDRGITCCLVESSMPGVTIGNRHRPHGTPWYNGPIRGKDVFIPLESVIGGEKMIGKGWFMLNECLSIGRSLSLPTIATAFAANAFLGTSAYASIREQFQVPIGHFEGIQEKMAIIGGLTYLMDSTLSLNIAAVDSGLKPSVASAIGKYHVTEFGRIVVNAAMDIHGGKAVIDGPSNYLGSAYDNIPATITVEGANIMTRNLIIFGQGMIRCHPYIYEEIKAASITDPQKALKTFDQLFFAHVGYIIHNTIIAGVRGMTRGYFISVPPHPLAKYLKQITWLSSALSITSEVAMISLAGKLKFKERLSARLGDALSYLYMASAVVKYFDSNKNQAEEMDYATWALEYCLHEAQKALFGFYRNFPIRWLSLLLRLRLFPWGFNLKPPTDKLSQMVALNMMQPSSFRDRLKNYLHIPDSTDHPLGLMEETYRQILKTAPLQKKIKLAIKAGKILKDIPYNEKIDQALAIKILTKQEAKTLKQAEELRWKAIQVDEFDANLKPLKKKP